MRDAGISLPKHYVQIGDFPRRIGVSCGVQTDRLEGPPTALFVANSEMTLGALTALRERHVNVPRDLSIVGFDDPLWARHLDPALTVVTQPIVEMAKMATGLLLSLLQDSEVIRSEILPPDLMIRQSTALR